VNGVHTVDIDPDKFCGVIGVRDGYTVRKRFVFPVGKVGIEIDTKVLVCIMITTFSGVDDFIDNFSKK
jgi:hypothetical protein